jgi:hypothetical protein
MGDENKDELTGGIRRRNRMTRWGAVRAVLIAGGLTLLLGAVGDFAAGDNASPAQPEYVPTSFLIVLLASGLFLVALGVFGKLLARAVANVRRPDAGANRSPRRGRAATAGLPVSATAAGPFRIRGLERRADCLAGIALAGLLALAAPWGGPRWFRDLPVRVTDGYLAVAALAVLAGLWRAWRMALCLDDNGVTVRNLLRTHRFSWPAIRRFADGSALGDTSRAYWAVRVVPRDGKAVTAAATIRSGAPWPPMVAAVQQAAARYGIPADLTGNPFSTAEERQAAVPRETAGDLAIRRITRRRGSRAGRQ